MKTVTDIEELRRRHYEARDALSAAEAADKDRRNAKLVGKCFRAKTSYSRDYRPLYGKVLAIDDGAIIMFEFSRDRDGMYTIESRVRRFSLFTGFEKISSAKFRAAWEKMTTEMAERAESALDL